MSGEPVIEKLTVSFWKSGYPERYVSVNGFGCVDGFLILKLNPKVEVEKMIVIAKLKVQEGKGADLEKVVNDILPKVKTEEGTLVYNFQRSKKDPTVYVFYEKYTDQEALAAHSGTPHFKEMSAALGSLLAAPPEIEMYDELGNID